MEHLVIDTSILRQDPRREKAAFKVVISVSMAGDLMFHIPEIVKREFLSQEFENYEEQLKNFRKAATSLSKKSLPEYLKRKFSELIEVYPSDSMSIRSHIEEEFDYWAADISATEHPPKSDHTSKVFDAYFDGKPPFKSKKNRADIPDAFIAESIRDIAEEVDDLHAVIADKTLRKAVEIETNITVYESLEKFVESAPFLNLLKEDHSKANFEAVIAKLEERSPGMQIFDQSALADMLYGQEMHSDMIPGENNEATILGIDEPSEIEFDFERAKYIGSGIGTFPFSCDVECRMYFSIFKGDYYVMAEEELAEFSVEELNDHYFGAEQTLLVQVDGLLRVELNPEGLKKAQFSEEAGAEVLDGASFAIEKIADLTISSEFE